jgi:hypothetical protein
MKLRDSFDRFFFLHNELGMVTFVTTNFSFFSLYEHDTKKTNKIMGTRTNDKRTVNCYDKRSAIKKLIRTTLNSSGLHN